MIDDDETDWKVVACGASTSELGEHDPSCPSRQVQTGEIHAIEGRYGDASR